LTHIVDLFSCTRKTIKSDFCRTFYHGQFIDPTLTNMSIWSFPQAPTHVWSIWRRYLFFASQTAFSKKLRLTFRAERGILGQKNACMGKQRLNLAA
jgi:hypothetical protein